MAVPHKRLLPQFEGYGITNNQHKWINAFLNGRRQRVVKSESSGLATVKSGVPQGSELGPLLPEFLIFINDLAENTTSTVRLFAGDCVMYWPIGVQRNAKNYKTTSTSYMEENGEKMWQLSFNAAKCNILRATHAKQNTITKNYELNGVTLTETSSTTYLGVDLSADMKWNTHVKKTTANAKGNQM